MSGCGVVWEWQPPYTGTPHLRHVCGQDTEGVHGCRDCACWVTDDGLRYYGVRDDAGYAHEIGPIMPENGADKALISLENGLHSALSKPDNGINYAC